MNNIINNFNQKLIDNSIDLNIINYIIEVNEITYNINVSFIHDFFNLVDRDECCINHEIYKYKKTIESLNDMLTQKKILILQQENDFKINVNQNVKIEDLEYDILFAKYGIEKTALLSCINEIERIINLYNSYIEKHISYLSY